MAAAENLCLLYFSSPRSGPSRRGDGFLSQVLQERGNHHAFDRLMIDVDRYPWIASSFAISHLPTVVVLERGAEACRIEGRAGIETLRTALAPWLR